MPMNPTTKCENDAQTCVQGLRAGGVSYGNTETPPGDVSLKLSSLEQIVADMEGTVALAIEKMVPVLRPPLEQEKCLAADPPSQTPLGDKIQSVISSLDAANRQLADLIERIGL